MPLTATTTNRRPLIAMQLLRAGIRDGIDLPEAEDVDLGPAFRRGCTIGRKVSKISRRAA